MSVSHFQTTPTVAVRCRLCFTRLKLLLVAITVKVEDQDYNHVALNPGTDAVIDEDSKGFFICESEDEVKRCAGSVPLVK